MSLGPSLIFVTLPILNLPLQQPASSYFLNGWVTLYQNVKKKGPDKVTAVEVPTECQDNHSHNAVQISAEMNRPCCLYVRVPLRRKYYVALGAAKCGICGK